MNTVATAIDDQYPAPALPSWLAALERRIAINAARADIESMCRAAQSQCQRDGKGWATWFDSTAFDLPDKVEPDARDRAAVADAVRYLAGLGMIEHHHQHPTWVRIREHA